MRGGRIASKGRLILWRPVVLGGWPLSFVAKPKLSARPHPTKSVSKLSSIVCSPLMYVYSLSLAHLPPIIIYLYGTNVLNTVALSADVSEYTYRAKARG